MCSIRTGCFVKIERARVVRTICPPPSPCEPSIIIIGSPEYHLSCRFSFITLHYRKEANGGGCRMQWISRLMWIAAAFVGAWAISVIALTRGESINAIWFVIAAVCVYAIG